jgi:hypothetical protein
MLSISNLMLVLLLEVCGQLILGESLLKSPS